MQLGAAQQGKEQGNKNASCAPARVLARPLAATWRMRRPGCRAQTQCPAGGRLQREKGPQGGALLACK